jgi:hypothetical protein
MASLYNPTFTATTAAPIDDTGSKWCSTWYNKLAFDSKTETFLVASNGLSGKSKCTFLLTTDNGTAAPGFRLLNADYANFLLHYVEWITVAGLGTNGVLNAADGGLFHLGKYETTNGEVYLNPAVGTVDPDTVWLKSAFSPAYDQRDPRVRPPGSVGDAIFYT